MFLSMKEIMLESGILTQISPHKLPKVTEDPGTRLFQESDFSLALPKRSETPQKNLQSQFQECRLPRKMSFRCPC